MDLASVHLRSDLRALHGLLGQIRMSIKHMSHVTSSCYYTGLDFNPNSLDPFS